MTESVVEGLAYLRKAKALQIDFRNARDGKGKVKSKRLKFRTIPPTETVDSIIDQLCNRYPQLFSRNSTSKQNQKTIEQLRKAVTLLVFEWAASAEISAPVKPDREEEVDLNRVSEQENRRAKAAMDVLFEAQRVKPGDKEYVWDKRVEFAPAQGASDWDEEDDE